MVDWLLSTTKQPPNHTLLSLSEMLELTRRAKVRELVSEDEESLVSEGKKKWCKGIHSPSPGRQKITSFNLLRMTLHGMEYSSEYHSCQFGSPVPAVCPSQPLVHPQPYSWHGKSKKPSLVTVQALFNRS